ncbi:helix-turn-helix domain-containing protein [Rhodohalobacter mucosus]|uniref:Helix-turn-helix domain-containing protein n=1 Tax=Rhodohalobacter mucosus TaxID=2079485 RepID=A0A316TQB8_9BACT|nr:helix-turn-helix domain-containing protein [Rhodohalobacter mucosus]PWN06797.1 hypothetical protein DDZ15_05855 [Rhodohalobacter mucosus]
MPSLGKDLETIRKHLGLTIQDVQNATKLPLNTLKSIENDDIFEQQEENITYVRSFIRTYARNLKLDDELVTRALDQEEIGNYNHLLLSAFPELSKEVESGKKQGSDVKDRDSDADPGDIDTKKTPEPEQKKTRTRPRFIADFPEDPQVPVESEKTTSPGKEPVPDKHAAAKDDGETDVKSDSSDSLNAEKTPPKKDVRQVNWADMGKKFSDTERKPPVWVIGAAVVIIAVLAGIFLLSRADLFTTDTPEAGEASQAQTGDDARLDPGTDGPVLDLSEEQQVPEQVETPVLQDTLYLTVYAANERLDPVRVWSDLKPRIDPYWIEQGTALNFEFSDTIRIRGQYARMLLFLNGHLIENFRQQYFNEEQNAVELSRSLFSDPEWAVEIPIEVPANVAPPDSVAFRPTF